MARLEQLETRVRRILVAALPGALRVAVAPRRDGLGSSFDVAVEAGVAHHQFLAAWAGEGWPGDVEKLVHLVPGVEVVIAVNLSERARDLLAGRGVGWVDEAGHAEITRPSGLVISREPAQLAPRPVSPPPRWSRSTLAVAEAALSGTIPTVQNIETVTGLSRNATATALDKLERLGFLQRSQALRGPMSGRRVADTDAFLTAYVEAATEQRTKAPKLLVHRLWVGDAIETLRAEIAPALNTAESRWAVTGVAASILLAPYLSEVTTLDLYVDPELFANKARLASRLGGRIVERGHVAEVRPLPTPMVATGPIVDGIQVALPVRVYADLVSSGGRVAEAAQHLKEVRDVGSHS
ncbi:MAG: type IV toxin-antitoxin system AbiEi family antitoxin [Acidimicrobiales bacterium]|jgi:hypothetical protein